MSLRELSTWELRTIYRLLDSHVQGAWEWCFSNFHFRINCLKVLVAQSCLTLWFCGSCPPGSSAHGILQARILEWVAMPSSRASSRYRDWTLVSCIAGRFFTVWAIGEIPLITNSLSALWNADLNTKGLEWGLRFCISKKLPSDVNVLVQDHT